MDEQDKGTSLVAHVDHLRGLAQLDGNTTLVELAIINVLGELATAVDRLQAQNPPPPDDDGGWFGTV